MAYGTVKVDNITFDNGGSDQNVTVSGLYNSLTSGITVTGTISGAVVIGSTSVSGTTVAGVTVTGTTVQGASGTFTSLTGTTIQGTTATYTTGSFTSLTGTTTTGTTSSFTSGVFTTLSGATATFTSGIIASGTAAAPSLAILGDPDTGVFSPGANQLAVATNATERLRIDSSGRLLVGTSSARTVGSAGVLSQIESTSGDAGLSIVRNSNGNTGGGLTLAKSRGTSNGSSTIVQSGDDLGLVQFAGADGNDIASIAARIACQVDGTPGADDMPGRLVFSTTADGASTPTERMRIASNGSIFFAATSESSITSGAANGKFINSLAEMYSSRATTEAASHILFYNPNGYVGQISTTAAATSYATSSDYRLKENVTLLDGAIARLNQLPVHRFNFIADPDTVVDGFIAHEAAAVVPECVTGEKDEEDENGDPVYQGIDQSKVVPLLTAALQEAIAKIHALEARVAALEA
jgi:hypothetical protein